MQAHGQLAASNYANTSLHSNRSWIAFMIVVAREGDWPLTMRPLMPMAQLQPTGNLFNRRLLCLQMLEVSVSVTSPLALHCDLAV